MILFYAVVIITLFIANKCKEDSFNFNAVTSKLLKAMELIFSLEKRFNFSFSSKKGRLLNFFLQISNTHKPLRGK